MLMQLPRGHLWRPKLPPARDYRTRILMIYYCILVLDRANDQKFNPNGIDVRPLIAATARGMITQKGLTHQKQYLADLDRLSRKYPM
jgi:hypothetical protein